MKHGETRNTRKGITKKNIPNRQRAWNSMRIFRNFSVADIAATAEVNPRVVKTFLRQLVRAGYVREKCLPGWDIMGRRCTDRVYELLIDSGPRAPRTRRNIPILEGVTTVKKEGKGLFDPNTGKTIMFYESGAAGQKSTTGGGKWTG